MNRSQRQVVAEKIGSTVRVLELLGLEYEVTNPRNTKRDGNRSPRVIHVQLNKKPLLRIYNSVTGSTWANESGGKPIASVKSIESLYKYLLERVAD
jgi:hypothetical protein